jgi:hypothetical protein
MAKQTIVIDPKHGEASGKRPVEPELVTDVERNAKIEQLRQIAEFMDGQFRIPGTNVEFGADAIFGLVPGVGDLLCGALSLWLIREAKLIGAPGWLVARMVWNVVVDVGLGSVPVFGDLFDVAWKANRKNIQLLTRYFDSLPPH